LQDTKNNFSAVLQHLFVSRRPGNENFSLLWKIKFIKENLHMLPNTQQIEKQYPELAARYPEIEKIIDPRVLDSNMERLANGTFDTQEINNYLPIIARLVKEYIDEIEKIVKNTAQIARIDASRLNSLQKDNQKEACFAAINQSQELVEYFNKGLANPITTIITLVHNKDPKLHTEKWLKSLIETLEKYEQPINEIQEDSE